MRTDEEIKAGIAAKGACYALNEQQAAAFLETTVSALRTSRETRRRGPDGHAKPPFRKVRGRVVYDVTALIAYHIESSSNGATPFMQTLSVMLGEAFCKQVGVPFPSAHGAMPAAASSRLPAVVPESATDTTSAVSSPSLLSSLLGVTPTGGAAASNAATDCRKRGPKPRKIEEAERRELERLGAYVRVNRCEFASLHDFLIHAEPEDEWLFSCPVEGRPYDAIAAIFAGPGDEFFEWLSLSEYLERVRLHAQKIRSVRVAEEEYAALLDPGVTEPGFTVPTKAP